jgi:hypothetical protein
MATLDEAIAALSQKVDLNNQSMVNNQLLGDIGRVGGTGLALGVGARGLWGLMQQLSRNSRKPRQSIPGPMEVEIPVEEIDDKYAESKEANTGMLDWAGKKTNDALGSIGDTVKKYFNSGYANKPQGSPWYLPGVVGAGIGGVAGGWALSDWLMDQRRRQAMKEELEQAKQEYNDALFGKLSSVLDELYDNLQEAEKQTQEKQAQDAPTLTAGNTAGMLGGVGLTYAGLTSLMAAMASYNSAKSRQRKTLLQRAQKERQRQRYESQPSPIYAVPVPVQKDELADEASPFYAGPKL